MKRAKWIFAAMILLLVQASCRRATTPLKISNDTEKKNDCHQAMNNDYNLSSNEVNELTLIVHKNGDADAAVKLANYYGFVRFDLDKWVKYLTISATNGNSASQYNLGVIYSTVPEIKDVEQARKWFDAAAKSGNPSARARLEEIETNHEKTDRTIHANH